MDWKKQRRKSEEQVREKKRGEEKKREEKRREGKGREEKREGKRRGKGREEMEKIRQGESQKREDAGARKGTEVAKHCVFPMLCGSGGSRSRLAKAEEMKDEKLHAVVMRSTFPSQNVQNTPGADNFWKLRCRKSARSCGAKQISQSNV